MTTRTSTKVARTAPKGSLGTEVVARSLKQPATSLTPPEPGTDARSKLPKRATRRLAADSNLRAP
jgi:hypothetical protein